MELKKITAIVPADRLEDVENGLKGLTPGLSVDHVKGYGEYANFFTRDWTSRHARIEIVAEGAKAKRIVDAILQIAHTGAEGDGIVYVVPIEETYRIRDQHREHSTASCPTCRANAKLRRQKRRQPAGPKRA